MITFKILILGESMVGKTSFSQAFCYQDFNEYNLSTVGIERHRKIIKIENKSIFLDIYDTAGQENYRTLVRSFIGGADGILLLYDISDKNSFDLVSKWMKSLEDYVDLKEIGLIIVGNKIDLQEECRQVTVEMREELEERHKVRVMEASAKENINVKEIFELLTDDMIKIKSKGKSHEDLKSFKIRKDDYNESHSKFC